MSAAEVRPGLAHGLRRRPPFAWEVQLAEEVLDDAVAEFQSRPYADLRRIVRRPVRKTLRTRDDKKCRVKVSARSAKSGLIVNVRLKRGWLGPVLERAFGVEEAEAASDGDPFQEPRAYR